MCGGFDTERGWAMLLIHVLGDVESIGDELAILYLLGSWGEIFVTPGWSRVSCLGITATW